MTRRVWVLWTRMSGRARGYAQTPWYPVATGMTRRGLPWREWRSDGDGRQTRATFAMVKQPGWKER